MALLEIVVDGHPSLRRKASRVARVDDFVRKLMDDMTETMLAAPGVGLAAPQVNVPVRVITMKVDNQVFQLANPEMVKAEGEQVGYEGCLSIPGMVGIVTRADRVIAKGLNRHGKGVRVKGNGLLARCIQHEIDHLDGILFTDRLDEPGSLRRVDELTEAEAESVEGEVVPA